MQKKLSVILAALYAASCTNAFAADDISVFFRELALEQWSENLEQ